MEKVQFRRRELLCAAAALPLAGGCATQPMNNRNLTSMTATQALDAMRGGTLKAEDYAQALLARAREMRQLNAFIALSDADILESARNADRARAAGRSLGALHGLPIAVKDSVNTRAYPTTNGTRGLRGFRPASDAVLAQKLFAQGAICFGKTNMTELSFGWTSNNGEFGPVRNPHDPTRIPGGSSGGSAAAVASQIVPIAVAADTLGSIRVPAAMCGVYGLRPTFGRYSGEGVFALTRNKFDQAGPLARSVADLALFDFAQTGQTTPAPATSLKGVRLGVPGFYHAELDAEILRATQEAYRRLREAGAVLVEVDVSADMKAAFDVAATIMLFDTVPSIGDFLGQQRTGLTFEQLFAQVSPPMQAFMQQTALPPHRPPEEAYRAMVAQRGQVQAATARFFADNGLSAMVFPAISALPAPVGEESDAQIQGRKVSFFKAYGRNTALGPVASLASLVIPVGLSTGGLPIALEVSKLPGQDLELLQLGGALEPVIGALAKPRLAPSGAAAA